MHNRFILYLFGIGMTLFVFFGFSTHAFAQNASTTNTINAEILYTIWYSDTDVTNGEIVKIYAGFQNHSEKRLSGTAGFYIDDIEMTKSNFVANPNSLVKLESPYTAIGGKHKTQVKILEVSEVGENTNNPLAVNNLLAVETEKKELNVQREMTKETILQTVNDIASKITETANSYADKLADYVEGMKKELASTTTSNTSTLQTDKTGTGRVLGTSTEDTKNTEKEGFSFYNSLLGALAFLIRKWVWILSIVFIYILYSVFIRD
ncbi:MAG: hypothetical protein A2566_00505 [Candidatus Zambryskibacteria bacterium RIFOXYD1_FULL_40_13]|nr:MAG: hypothetical protein A2566_00505 [Candidatus Zambryskibacteria bacterium RIFOXYD1_FULL_40_13]HBD24987.1 hypothetical protein [Candidatus Zambryskibacteria bacterium]HBO17860.1 hypothetical protein [Candidatus Zambryskibacteria bacterium]HBZ04559.1 hypothetical protein [Candidatus Zambryskibacteria bacterium]HCH59735.1 hypothetical protein [Candidatus Zambryskibacteria bacterium]